MDVFPANATIPAESGPHLIKLSGIPKTTGDLNIYGNILLFILQNLLFNSIIIILHNYQFCSILQTIESTVIKNSKLMIA